MNSLTIDEAIKVLNMFKHRKSTEWEYHSCIPRGELDLFQFARCSDKFIDAKEISPNWLPSFEAIAVAEKYIRENAVLITVMYRTLNTGEKK